MNHSHRALRTSAVIVLLSFLLSLDLRAEEFLSVGASDPIRAFHDPALALAVSPASIRPDSMLRGGPTGPPSPICAWITGDYGEDKGRNYLEGGISTEIVLLKNSRYPLVVSLPISTALGDEQYFFGPHFGYVSAGVNVRVPLSFVPIRYGQWTAGSTVDVCGFGTTMGEFKRSLGPQLPNVAAVLSVEL